jgi:PAS domain S-box-containing protein
MKFLIIDDNPNDRELIIRELRKEFSEAEFEEVKQLTDFERALACGDFDVALTDYRLQWTDGLWILQQIRGRDPCLPVIMVTDTSAEEIAVEGMKSGLSDYILKRHLRRLPVAVKETMEKARLRSECNQALVRETDESDLLHETCRIIVEVGGYRLAWVGFAEQNEQKTVRPVAQAGYEEGYLDTVNITWADTERGRGPTGKAIRTGKFSICKNTLTDPDYTPWRDEALKRGYGSSIALPLIADSQTFGALNIYAVQPDAFDAEEVKLLTELANDLSYGIMAIRAHVEQRRAEETLRASEAKYRTLVENIPQKIFLKDTHSRYLSVNQNYARDLGYSPEEVVGRDDFDFHPKALAEKYRADDRRIINEGITDEFDEEYTVDGELRYVHTIKTPVKDENGNLIGVLGVFRDITERKRMEEDLKESNRRLEETLAELKATQQQIIQQERLRALGEMASGIAHDFNNALTPILGYSEVLLDVPELLNDKEKMKHYLKQMNTAAKDAQNTVSRLREFYRRREEDEIFMPVNLNQQVKQAIELTQPKWKGQAQSNGITISIETDLQKVPIISGNESDLRGVLTNLIINSVDAMKENGTITLRTRHKGKHVVLEVSDTGIGMTEKVKQRCFEPFFTTKIEHGTGLGLSIVYGIIQRHEGTIEVDSELGKGTTFIISLPIQIERRGEERVQETVALSRSLYVLVVDDEPMVREVVTAYLTVDGHTFETATNGREGVEKFYKGKFDLVITDRAMPDMNGIQLAGLIKQIAPKAPVIMLTGFGDMMKFTGEMPVCVDCLVSKPVTLVEFRKALAKAIAE